MNKYLFLIVVTAFFSAVSQILLNISSRKNYSSKIREYFNPCVILSYMILSAVLITNVHIMKYVDLKNGHVVGASAYLFALLLSRLIFGEKITAKKLIGNIMIIAGIIIFIM